MKIFYRTIIIAALSGLLLLTGCDKTADESSEQSVYSKITVSGTVDDQGAFPALSCGVRLEKAPEKLICLSPALTEMICELGFKDRIIGISDYCDYPEGLDVPKTGSTENPATEQIIDLAPDAVFTLSPLPERDIYALEQAGISVLTATPPRDLEGYSALYREIASAFYGNEKTAGEKETLKAVEIGSDARLALEKKAKETTLGTFVYLTEKLTAAGENTFENAVLGLCGDNLCKSDGYAGTDSLGTEAPAYIIADDSLKPDDLTGNEVINGYIEAGAKVRFVSSRCFVRPTARTADIFAQIASGTDDAFNTGDDDDNGDNGYDDDDYYDDY